MRLYLAVLLAAMWDLDDKKLRLHKTTQQRFYAKPATCVAGVLRL